MSLNSTMVRLKQLKKGFYYGYSLLSQFHYGSIKTNLFQKGFFKGMQSQFHYGSIKTKALMVKYI